MIIIEKEVLDYEKNNIKYYINIPKLCYEENNDKNFLKNEMIESINQFISEDIFIFIDMIEDDYNISKKEWVLDGATVIYGSASELRATLEYDFSEEKKFSYKGLNMDEIIHHLAIFVSRLWQIHIFGEGNTRTTAVFFIKYLRTLGF